jgi:hypothetical protein
MPIRTIPIDTIRQLAYTSTALGLSYCTATHHVGKLSLTMTNGGLIGAFSPYTGDSSGCHYGAVPVGANPYGFAGEYPLGSGDKFLADAGLWVGGVTRSGDTLVSVGFDIGDGAGAVNVEMNPDPDHPEGFTVQSLFDSSGSVLPRSDEDYTCCFTDTVTYGVPWLSLDWRTHKRHTPLKIKVSQTSSQWSNALVDDIVLIEYKIENIGREDIHSTYAGLYYLPDVGHFNGSSGGLAFDGATVGFVNAIAPQQGCSGSDSLGLAWWSSFAGVPDLKGEWVTSGADKSDRSAFGLRIVQLPSQSSSVSFNWWFPFWPSYPPADYGPRHRWRNGLPPRDFGTGSTGTPPGDADKYYVMSNGEIDIDQMMLPTLSEVDPVWEAPTYFARLFAIGGWPVGLLSAGPFELKHGETKSIVFAIVGAENFHKVPHRSDRDSASWYSHVDFTDLIKNAQMAGWVYDNPGVDTDHDGYAGKFHVCVLDSIYQDGHWVPSAAETTYYTGDGVPDWRAVGAPPAPWFTLHPSYRGITVRFNGKYSETEKDLVTNRVDFEGYRIYCGLDDRESSLATVAGYDKQDYDKMVWNPNVGIAGLWQIRETPFTVEQLRCMYGQGADPCHDSTFHPLNHGIIAPLRPLATPDSIIAFQPHDYNASDLTKQSGIHKAYPEATEPVSGVPLTPDQLTEDGLPKYYEYEYTIPNLLPTMQYFVNVTAFDYGDPNSKTEPLESSKNLNIRTAYALGDSSQLASTLPPVYIYPNPYYGDGRYRNAGYEGRGDERIDDRVRRIHFVNVPAKCTVRILTLDGDLVKEIPHDYAPTDGLAHHETWDMINKNTQTVTSGLYYWSVEGEDGKVQIGKLVIIR